MERIACKIDGFARNYDELAAWPSEARARLRKHLAFTMFVPGGRADRAKQAVLDLHAAGLLGGDAEAWGWSRAARIADVVRPNVRFHKTKAMRLVKAVPYVENTVKLRMGSVRAGASTIRAAVVRDVHDALSNVAGMGPKATAHFMRNIGMFCDELTYPIIDVHIHKLLGACYLEHGKYADAARSFYTLASLTGIPVAYLDAYVWCCYSGNWAPENADFDNFGPEDEK